MRAGWCWVRSMKMINLLWAVVIAMLSACEKEQVVTEKEQAVMKTSKSDVNTTVDSSTFSGHIENEEDIDFEQEHKRAYERADDYRSNAKYPSNARWTMCEKPNKEYRWIYCSFNDGPNEIFYFKTEQHADKFSARLAVDKKN
jgi:hypothetical protein